LHRPDERQNHDKDGRVRGRNDHRATHHGTPRVTSISDRSGPSAGRSRGAMPSV
jgi:hypothetical protein